MSDDQNLRMSTGKHASQLVKERIKTQSDVAVVVDEYQQSIKNEALLDIDDEWLERRQHQELKS